MLFVGVPRVSFIVSMALTFLLAWAALLLPIDQPLSLGSLEFKLVPTLFILGRSLNLTVSEQPLLLGMWSFAFLWLAGGLFARPPRLFPALVLIVISLLIAALTVDPFIYAALLFELAVMLCVPLLAPPGGTGRRPVLRLLTFMTIGMAFILFVGWMLEGAAASPGIAALTVRAGVLLGLGFAFLLPVFPFHSWVPMLTEEADSYSGAFFLFALPVAIAIFGLELVDRFVWLRRSEALQAILLTGGALMVVAGGLLASLEDRLGRQLGFAVMLETGMSMLAVAAYQPIQTTLFFALLLPRGISLLIWAAALGNLGGIGTIRPTLESVRGLGRRYPLRFGAILLAIFSLAGLPLLSGFPFRLILIQQLAVTANWAAAAVLLGNFGLLSAGFRLIASIVSEAPNLPEGATELTLDSTLKSVPDFSAWVFITVAGLGSLLVGLFPFLFWTFFERLPAIFAQLGR